MNIIDIAVDEGSTLVFQINCLAVGIVLILIMVLLFLVKQCSKYLNKKSVMINEFNLGIGNSSVKLSYNKKDQEIAYKIWVELSTRKIGLRFDEENDVIKEVYQLMKQYSNSLKQIRSFYLLIQ